MAELLAAIEAGDMDLLRRLLADRADPDARHQKVQLYPLSALLTSVR